MSRLTPEMQHCAPIPPRPCPSPAPAGPSRGTSGTWDDPARPTSSPPYYHGFYRAIREGREGRPAALQRRLPTVDGGSFRDLMRHSTVGPTVILADWFDSHAFAARAIALSQ